MILLNEDMNRTITRNALGFKTLKIDEDITCGMDVTLNLDSETRELFLNKATDEEVAEAEANGTSDEVTLLVSEFSPVKNLKSLCTEKTRLEVIFNGDLMYIKLSKGALFVKKPVQLDDSADSDHSQILVYSNSPELEVEGIKIDTATSWMNTDRLKSFCLNWGNHSKEHIEDYVYEMEIWLDKSGMLSVKPVNVLDISLGELSHLDAKLEKIDKDRQTRQLQKEVHQAEKLAVEYSNNDDEYEDQGVGTGEVTEYDEYDEEYVQ